MSILSLLNFRNIIKKPNKDIIYCPVSGKLLRLKDINDEMFSKNILGEGFAVYPNDDTIAAPVSGTIISIFPTKHAFTIFGDNGCELLIHIGLDTVKLQGKYFSYKVKEGDYVRAGQAILKVDFNKINSLSYDISTMVVICNSNDYSLQCIHQDNKVSRNNSILKLIKKEVIYDY